MSILDNAIELAPLRTTSSQELEWDPAGAQLVSTVSNLVNLKIYLCNLTIIYIYFC